MHFFAYKKISACKPGCANFLPFSFSLLFRDFDGDVRIRVLAYEKEKQNEEFRTKRGDGLFSNVLNYFKVSNVGAVVRIVVLVVK